MGFFNSSKPNSNINLIFPTSGNRMADSFECHLHLDVLYFLFRENSWASFERCTAQKYSKASEVRLKSVMISPANFFFGNRKKYRKNSRYCSEKTRWPILKKQGSHERKKTSNVLNREVFVS